MLPGFGNSSASLWRDPFLREPFGGQDPLAQMEELHRQMMGQTLGQAAPHPHQQQQQYYGGQQQQYYGGQQQQQQQQAHSHGPPLIEEVHEDTQATARHPVVEEPDEEDQDPTQRSTQRPRHASPPSHRSTSAANSSIPVATQPAVPYPQQLQNRPSSLLDAFFGGGLFPSFGTLANMPMGGASFSYSSSTFVSGGPGGMTYQESHVSRSGPGGVRESQSMVRDGRSGHQAMSVTRALGERERTLTRMRDASGREVGNERLRGLSQDQAHRFEQEWMQQAQQVLSPDPFSRAPPVHARGMLQRQASGQRTMPQALPAPDMAAYSSAAAQQQGSLPRAQSTMHPPRSAAAPPTYRMPSATAAPNATGAYCHQGYPQAGAYDQPR